MAGKHAQPCGSLRSALVILLLAGCGEPPLAESAAGPAAAVVIPTATNAAVYWNEVAREMVIANRSPAPVAIRGYAIVSIAQYHAAIAAEKGKTRNVHPSIPAAVGAASVVALSYLYPAEAAGLENRLAHFLDLPSDPGEQRFAVTTGVVIGRSAAEDVVDRARTDRFFAPGTVEVPVGPGLWFSATPPVGPLWGQALPFLLQSGDQFRPPPPPPFGSPAFLAALAEVRAISDARTPEQEANAQFWDFPPGTYTPPGYWNETGARLALRYRLGDRAAAHMFALLNIVSYDAIVASHEAKYFYWLLRPTQADPLITTAIPLPNFPTYPSNHAAVSAGMARVLSHVFPAEKRRLDALAAEAALSRVIAGIHYRFDGDAGLALGRAVAEWAIANDVRGHEMFVLR